MDKNSPIHCIARPPEQYRVHKKARNSHVEIGAARMKRDEKEVSNIKTCIETWLPDLWEENHPITNFSTGEIARTEMTADIIDMMKRGEDARNKLIDRFTKSDVKLTYYDLIKRQDIKLFEKKKQHKKHSIPEDF